MTHETHQIVYERDGYRVTLADSVTSIQPGSIRDVCVVGSHCGANVGPYAIHGGVVGLIGNDAGGGLDGAGIATIMWLDTHGIPAAAVDCMTAEIGVARTTWETGVISVVNKGARALGVEVGMAAQEAARRMVDAAVTEDTTSEKTATDAIAEKRSSTGTGPDSPPREVAARGTTRIILIDSAGSFSPDMAGAIAVDGSHFGANTGRMALDAGLRGRIGNDAGVGLNNAGIRGLQVMEEAGFPAAAVASSSARIGSSTSTWTTGVISACNDPARRMGIQPGMPAQTAAERMLR